MKNGLPNKPVEWSRKEIPKEIKVLPEVEAQLYFDSYDRLMEARPCPARGYAGREIDWPVSSLVARLIPAGIMPLDADEGYNHDKILQDFFEQHSPEGVVAFSLPAKRQGAFKARYGDVLVHWLRTELIASPLVLISPSHDIVLVANEQLDFSVIGAEPNIIADLEARFGGAQQLKAIFAEWVDSNSLGFGDDDRQWAMDYIVKWCGW